MPLVPFTEVQIMFFVIGASPFAWSCQDDTRSTNAIISISEIISRGFLTMFSFPSFP